MFEIYRIILQSKSVTFCVCACVCVYVSQSANFMKSIIKAQDLRCWHGDQLALIFHTQLSYLCSHRKTPLNLWDSHCACGSKLSYSVNVCEEKHLYLKVKIREQSLIHDAVDYRLRLVNSGWKRKLTLLIYLFLCDEIRGKDYTSATVCPPACPSHSIIPATDWIFN